MGWSRHPKCDAFEAKVDMNLMKTLSECREYDVEICDWQPAESATEYESRTKIYCNEQPPGGGTRKPGTRPG